MDTTTLINIPSFVYLGIIAVLGGIGNSLILIVYSRKKKKSATTIFIQFLAVVDLVTVVVVIPATVCVRLSSSAFTFIYLCQTYVFINLAMLVVPMLTILAIAVTRYRKICVTLGWQVSNYQAKVTCVVIVAVACLVVTPYVITRSFMEPSKTMAETNSTVCYLDVSHKPMLWSVLTRGLVFLAYLICSLSLTIFYSRIGLKAWRHRFLHGVRFQPRRRSVKNKQNVDDTGNVDDTMTNQQPTPSGSDNKTVDTEDSTEISDTSNVGFSNNSTLETDTRHFTGLNSSFVSNSKLDAEKKPTQLKPSKPNRPFCGRITRMLICISTAYVLSYLTSITLSMVRVAFPEVFSSLDSGPKAVYSMLLLSHLVNVGLNPIFYSFYDRNFKKEAKKMLTSLRRRDNVKGRS